MYDTQFHANLYTYRAIYTTEFFKRYPTFNFFIEEASYILHDISLFDLIQKIVARIEEISTSTPNIKTTGIDNAAIVIEAKSNDIPILITINVGNTNNFRAMKASKRSVDVVAYSSKETVVDLFNWFDATYAGVKIAQINWWHKFRDSASYTSIPIDEPFVIKDKSYPFVKLDGKPIGVYEYFQTYLDSNCPLLFLSGPPGTGKTSFLRAMIWEFGLMASVTYDEDVLLKDEMFINFITGDPTLLILEDSEAYITSREHEKNSFMARFLNVSDGIVKTKNKKIIFTTNFSDFTDIDDALTRPGRCFDFLQFRKLKWNEVVEACAELKLDVPSMAASYSLAELFNQKHTPEIPERKVGF